MSKSNVISSAGENVYECLARTQETWRFLHTSISPSSPSATYNTINRVYYSISLFYLANIKALKYLRTVPCIEPFELCVQQTRPSSRRYSCFVLHVLLCCMLNTLKNSKQWKCIIMTIAPKQNHHHHRRHYNITKGCNIERNPYAYRYESGKGKQCTENHIKFSQSVGICIVYFIVSLNADCTMYISKAREGAFRRLGYILKCILTAILNKF